MIGSSPCPSRPSGRSRDRSGKWLKVDATPTKATRTSSGGDSGGEGVPAAILTGSAKYWDPVEEALVEGGEAIGITTYSAVFSSSPKLPQSQPQLLIFDDAHAGEQFAGNEYGISIRRYDEEVYLNVLEALKPFLSRVCLILTRTSSR